MPEEQEVVVLLGLEVHFPPKMSHLSAFLEQRLDLFLLDLEFSAAQQLLFASLAIVPSIHCTLYLRIVHTAQGPVSIVCIGLDMS